MENCSFKPIIHENLTATNSYTKLQKEANSIFNDLQQKIKYNKDKLDFTSKEEKELQECTFKPQINHNIKHQNKDPKEK